MGLNDLLVFCGLALAVRLLGGSRRRGWLLLGLNALAVYWLQPATPVRHLDFWLPTLTLTLVVLGWLVTTPPGERAWRAQTPALAVLAGVVLLAAAGRWLDGARFLTPTRPPQIEQALAALAVAALLAAAIGRSGRWNAAWLWGLFALILVCFVALKTPALAALVSAGVRTLEGQGTARAAAADLRWLGFSYVAFRLLHTIRDRQNGRLPSVSLQEYANYVLFFPAFTAGPIDRLERFLKDLRQPQPLGAVEFTVAAQRLAWGIFKKFVVADGLALVALSAQNAEQVRTTGWAWVLVYAYALQIYFDFSGYTDIALGMGRLVGIVLPENFKAPYLKPNLTQFWSNWHMTLTQWFRAYFFNPLTRALRGGSRPLAAVWIILITQVSTMVLIGLWHGVTWNFVLWGVWHGLGQFVQNRWSEWTRTRWAVLKTPRWQPWVNVVNVALTFHFVALGWVWFALPDVALSWRVLLRLFGIG